MKEIMIDSKVHSIQAEYGQMNGPQNLMFDITQNCNMHCMHCYNYSGDKKYKDLNDCGMLEITRQIIELKPCLVCLCGGEPTLRLPLVNQITRLLTDAGIIVNMVSNGILLDENSLKELYESGIENIQISLDSYREDVVNEFRGNKGAFKAAINAIDSILKLGRKPSVTFIPTKMNYKDVKGLATLLYTKEIYNVRYMPLIPIGRGKHNVEKLMLSGMEKEELYWSIKEIEEELEGFQFEYGDPLEHIYLYRNNYLAVTPSFEIKSNGDVQISCYIPYIFGNIMQYKLKKLWDMGLSSVWKQSEFNNIVKGINTLNDLELQERLPYENQDVNLLQDKIK